MKNKVLEIKNKSLIKNLKLLDNYIPEYYSNCLLEQQRLENEIK